VKIGQKTNFIALKSAVRRIVAQSATEAEWNNIKWSLIGVKTIQNFKLSNVGIPAGIR